MNPLEKMSDIDILKLMIATHTIRLATGSVEEESKVVECRIAEVLAKTLDNLGKVDALTSKLIDANDNLATERSSNRRMKKLLADLAVCLYEDPSRYPKELGDLVERIHKEVR